MCVRDDELAPMVFQAPMCELIDMTSAGASNKAASRENRSEIVTGTQEVSDAIGTELLFENERLRVWSMTLEPGESSPTHQHLSDWLYVYVTDDNLMETRFADGRRERSLFGDGFVGLHRVSDLGHQDLIHALYNAGSHTHRQILVEFKGEATAGEPMRSDNGRRREG
jgi:hypothetical protein